MKRSVLVVVLIILLKEGISQNLVPNGSFEVHDTCPNTISKISYAIPWINPTKGTPDYLDSCSTFYGVPTNPWDYQVPRTGHSYAGIAVYTYTGAYREYIQVKLLDSLIANRKYEVNFYVNLTFSQSYHYAISEIGMYLSNTPISSSGTTTLNFIPQIVSPSGMFLTDTANWMRINGTYTALGGEGYITIGNFSDNMNTDTLEMGAITSSKQSYYFIDDVSIEDSLLMSIRKTPAPQQLILFPNPTAEKVYITGLVSDEKNLKVEVMDVTGKVLLRSGVNVDRGLAQLDLPLNNGIYFIKIQGNSVSQTEKVIISK